MKFNLSLIFFLILLFLKLKFVYSLAENFSLIINTIPSSAETLPALAGGGGLAQTAQHNIM